jgi:asparagine synthase (glutamine-hydrolysing)
MSILLGVVEDRGMSASGEELLRLACATERYATHQSVFSTIGRAGMCCQLYLSHERSRMDTGPLTDMCGNTLSFDGRLDNFRELAEVLSLNAVSSSDSVIVLAAFRRWHEECFARFTGDWALSLWAAREQTLLLARDHAGTRSLYYSRTKSRTQWATYLDTFTASGSELHLSKEYAAAYLSNSPVRDLTPYQEIRSVLPGHYVVAREETISQRPHWSPVIRTSIRYQANTEYDDQFLSLFEQAVSRRTGPGEPIIAELSGGMDSTSIVCMSDSLRRSANSDAEILDTVSYFDDSEASLNERPYFSLTEERRGKVGSHFDVAFSRRSFDAPTSEFGSYSFPGHDHFSVELEHELLQNVWRKGYRSILSGIGGDEVLGGIPDGRPQLADYLVSGRLGTFFRRAVTWSLPERSPLIATVSDTIRYAARLSMGTSPKSRSIPPWISNELGNGCLKNVRTKNMVPRRIGTAPHRLENAMTWWQIMETLPHLSPRILFRPEYRYPMLDKDLVEFLFSIPPEQLVQPGRRRSMMRRALRGIVSVEILERRRKAFQLRAPMNAIRAAQPKLDRLIAGSRIAELGFIDTAALKRALRATADGSAEWYQAILRAIAYELWLGTRAGGTGLTDTAKDRQPICLSLAVP